METVLELSKGLHNTAKACSALEVSRATFYRGMGAPREREARPQPQSTRAIPLETRQAILDHLHSDEFADKSPSQTFHTLLDRGVHLASVRTFYRVLDANGEVKERRNQLRHPEYTRPELIATAPNQVWTWDITCAFRKCPLTGRYEWRPKRARQAQQPVQRPVVGWRRSTAGSSWPPRWPCSSRGATLRGLA